MNFKGFSGLRPTKKQKKEKIEAEKKEKILTKLVVRKEDKGFNVTNVNSLTTRWEMSLWVAFLLEMICFKVFPLMFIVS